MPARTTALGSASQRTRVILALAVLLVSISTLAPSTVSAVDPFVPHSPITAAPQVIDAVLAHYDLDQDQALNAEELAAYIGQVQQAVANGVRMNVNTDNNNNGNKLQVPGNGNQAKELAGAGVPTTTKRRVTSSTDTPFWSGFGSGILTIWATEIGDKTFFIAAVLSMKNSRVVVFAGALGALIVMTVLSVVVGVVATKFLPPAVTHYIGAALFVVFGLLMLWDGRKKSAGPSGELAQVEDELLDRTSSRQASDMEDGSASSRDDAESAEHAKDLMKLLMKTFVMTFLAEWGDRSQIATVTLSATKDMFGVTLGAVLGHSMCTGLAVVGGKLLATRISERTVAIAGGIIFLLFAVHSLVVGPPK